MAPEDLEEDLNNVLKWMRGTRSVEGINMPRFGLLSLILYTFAMALHFVVVNHSLSEEHGDLYRRHGHWVLAASVIAGWGLGRIEPFSDAVFARLFALLAGGVVITSLRAELPDDRRGRFWPFCLSAAGFSSLLMLA